MRPAQHGPVEAEEAVVALDAATGETVWQARGFARASLLHADGKTIR